jgi:hypothetical protein
MNEQLSTPDKDESGCYELAVNAAERLQPMTSGFDAQVQLAQVYATLALVDAVERLTDSYNGWKAIGK